MFAGLRRRPALSCSRENEGCSGKRSRASCTEGGRWEGIAKFLWLLMSPRRSTRWRSRKRAGPGKSVSSGMWENSLLPIERTLKRLAERYERLHVCFEAGPSGYGLYRQVKALGHDCLVVAPALIPKRSGERVKTNRRDAVTLARLHRAGELTGVWTPDAAHEAVRDLVRSREAAGDDLRRKRERLLSFLPRHGRIYSVGGHWTLAHRRWLAGQRFEHAAQQMVFQEGMDAIEDALLATGPPREATRFHRAGLVHGAGRGSLPGDARRFVSGRRDLCRRDRRRPPVRYAKTADVLPWSRPGGKLDRRHGATVAPCRRSSFPPGRDQGRTSAVLAYRTGGRRRSRRQRSRRPETKRRASPGRLPRPAPWTSPAR